VDFGDVAFSVERVKPKKTKVCMCVCEREREMERKREREMERKKERERTRKGVTTKNNFWLTTTVKASLRLLEMLALVKILKS